MRSDHLVTVPHVRSGALPAPVGLYFDNDACYLSVGPHFEIRPAVTNRPQKGLRAVPAPTAFLIDLEVANAFVVASIKIGRTWNTGFLRSPRERVENIPSKSLPFDTPLATGPMVIGKPMILVVDIETM